jgi:hypothetical protein
MEATVQTKAKSALEKMKIQKALQTLADNVNPDNLVWFAEITKRENFNEKLEAKKGFIKTFL